MKPARNLGSALAVAISLALGATNVRAATITVTTGDDIFHSSTCNLRNAIASLRDGAAQGSCAATGNFGDNDTVVFSPALANSTITLAHGELSIFSGTITIAGSGQTIDANYGSRVMYVNHATLVASNLTLTHGYAGGVDRDGRGAGIYAYSGNVTLNSVTVSRNVAVGDGAGIDIEAGNLVLSHTTVFDNASALSTGGISLYGVADISDSTISENSGGAIGGIAVFSGYSGGYGYGSIIGSDLTIARSSVSSNDAICSSRPCTGGIYSSVGNFVTIRESTISTNSSSGNFDRVAGGLYVYDSTLGIDNSTIASNSADGYNYVAGGMSITGTDYSSTMTNSTISANLATSRNAGANVRSGMLLGYGAGSKIMLRNLIIAGNESGTDFGAPDASGITMLTCVVGTIANVAPFNSAGNKNIFTDTPGLGPLKNNGGPTQTMALLENSIAIDTGQIVGSPTTYDQRGSGFARVFNVKIDIGAVEFQGDRIFAYGFEPAP